MIIESFFLLLSSLLGLISLGFLLFSAKSNKTVNLFLMLIIVVTCSRFILRAGFNFGWLDFAKDFMDPMKAILVYNIPVCFLYFFYFKSIINDTKIFERRFLIHLIVPSLFVCYLIAMYFLGLNETSMFKAINFVFLISLSIFYNIQTFFLLKKRLWSSSKKDQSKQERNMGNWTFSLFFMSVIWVIGFFVSLTLDFFSIESFEKGNFLLVQSIVWIVIFVIFLFSPDVLFGLPVFSKRMNFGMAEVETLSAYWKIDKGSISNPKDIKLEGKLDENIVHIIREIEYLAMNQHFFRNQKITISDVAKEMNIPLSHLVYVFKYHCQLNFTEYKTEVKIDDAKKRIQEGFLANNTLDALATEVGFSSYNPFFTAFKKWVGMSPNEYALSLPSKKKKMDNLINPNGDSFQVSFQ